MEPHIHRGVAAVLAMALGCAASTGAGPGPDSPPSRPARGEAPEAVAASDRCADGACPAAFLERAVRDRTAGRLDEALTHVRRALALDSRSVQAFHQLVLVHLAQAEGDASSLDRAALACRQGMQIDDGFAPLHNTCGVVDARRGRIVEALARFERAYTLDPELFEAWMNFGHVTLSFRGYEDAERAFRAALETRPDDYDARIGLGIALRGLRRLDEAREHYEHARRLDPGRPEAWYNLGILHQDHLGGTVEDYERATTYFEAFVAKAEGDPDYSEAVEEVVRCCPPARSERGAQECRPGRLANLRAAIDALGGSPGPRRC